MDYILDLLQNNKVESVEYRKGIRFNDMIFLQGKAKLLLDNEEEVMVLGGVVFADELE